MKSGYLALCLLLLMAGNARAQSDRASITGTVRETSGAVIEGVLVTASNVAHSIRQNATTNELGRYSLRNLPIGEYTLGGSKAEFADYQPVPLKAASHDELYSIGREAVVNAFRHSGAGRIEVELEYAPNRMRVMVRDNGCGIKPDVLRKGCDGHWGLFGMRERAERIGAKFKDLTGASTGTEVEVSVPADIVFHDPPSQGRWRWLTKPKFGWSRAEAPRVESEVVK